MNTHADRTLENKSQTVANRLPKLQSKSESTFQLVDNRLEAIAQRKLQEAISNSPRVQQLKAYHEMANNSPQVSKLRAIQDRANNSPQFSKAAQLQAVADNHSAQQQPIQKKENNTGLPDNLKTGMENLSGMSLDDVKVHHNSDKPAQLQAHAYAQGTDIHLGPGQEKHLPHEAWHVVQQKQGRVKPTMQMKGKVNVNDDAGLEKEADMMGELIMSGEGQKTLNLSKISSDSTNKVVQGKWYLDLPQDGLKESSHIYKLIQGYNESERIDNPKQLEIDLMLLKGIKNALNTLGDDAPDLLLTDLDGEILSVNNRIMVNKIIEDAAKKGSPPASEKGPPPAAKKGPPPAAEKGPPPAAKKGPPPAAEKGPPPAAKHNPSKDTPPSEPLTPPPLLFEVNKLAKPDSSIKHRGENLNIDVSALAGGATKKNKKPVPPLTPEIADQPKQSKDARRKNWLGRTKKIGTEGIIKTFKAEFEAGEFKSANQTLQLLRSKLDLLKLDKTVFFRDGEEQAADKYIADLELYVDQRQLDVNRKIEIVQLKNKPKGLFSPVAKMSGKLKDCIKGVEESTLDDDIKADLIQELEKLEPAIISLNNIVIDESHLIPDVALFVEINKRLEQIEQEIKSSGAKAPSKLKSKFDQFIQTKSKGDSIKMATAKKVAKTAAKAAATGATSVDPTGISGIAKGIALNSYSIYKTIKHINNLKNLDLNDSTTGNNWDKEMSEILGYKKKKAMLKGGGMIPVAGTIAGLGQMAYSKSQESKALKIAKELIGAFKLDDDHTAGAIIYELVGSANFDNAVDPSNEGIILRDKILPK